MSAVPPTESANPPPKVAAAPSGNDDWSVDFREND